MNFTPSFNAINDRQYIRPTYFNPDTGGIQYNPYAPTPTPVSAPPTGMAMGMPGPGMDFFSQLAGLINAQQSAQRGPVMGPTDRLAAAGRMPPTTGYGYTGGNRPLEKETMYRAARQGQMGRASGGRGSRPERPAQGFQPSTNFGKPRASEGFGDGRGFGGFR